MSEPVQLAIKALSPIHIGSGEEAYLQTEYLQKGEGTRARIDQGHLFSLMDEKIMLEFAEQSFQGNFDATRFLASKSLNPRTLYTIPFQATGRGTENLSEVKTQLRTAGKAYVPGSTLKGTLRAAWEWKKLGKDFSRMGNHDYIPGAKKEAEKASSGFNDQFKALKIGDSHTIPDDFTAIIDSEVIKPKRERDGSQIIQRQVPMIEEAISPGAAINVRAFGGELLAECLKLSNERCRLAARNELSFFKSLPEFTGKKDLTSFYEGLLAQKGALLRFGFGSSHTNMCLFYNDGVIPPEVAGDWKEKRRLPQLFKAAFKRKIKGEFKSMPLNSRKIAYFGGKAYPFGWCVVDGQ
jgi:CRISPR type III-A-associated RAMP protein Csm5